MVGVAMADAVAVAVKVGVLVGAAVGEGVPHDVSVYCWLLLVGVPGAELPAIA